MHPSFPDVESGRRRRGAAETQASAAAAAWAGSPKGWRKD